MLAHWPSPADDVSHGDPGRTRHAAAPPAARPPRERHRRCTSPAELVRRRAPRPALAPHARSLRDPRQRGHAPADPGRPGRAPLRGVAAAAGPTPARWPPRRSGTCWRRGSGWATTGARRACGRPAASSPARAGRATGRAAHAAGRRAVHRGRRRLVRLRRGRRLRRHERRARGRAARAGSPQALLEAAGASRAADWNQATMELGATVCGARAARCDACPVAAWCASRGAVAVARAPSGGRGTGARALGGLQPLGPRAASSPRWRRARGCPATCRPSGWSGRWRASCATASCGVATRGTR